MFPGGAILLLNISTQSLTRPLCGHSQPQHPNPSLKEAPAPSTRDFFKLLCTDQLHFYGILKCSFCQRDPSPSLEQRRVDTYVLIAGLTWQVNLNPSPS